jgi:uncharacterized protein (TIGR02145 family)
MNSKYVHNSRQPAANIFLFTIFLLCLIIAGCKKKDLQAPAQETDILTDRDGNTYKTVKIGSQWWMAENLKVKTYLNGDSIPYAQDALSWNHVQKGSCCIFDNQALYAPGLLYNGYAVRDNRGLAPSGWHIASDADWAKLEEYVGMSSDVAAKVGWRGSHEAEKLKKALSQTTFPGDWNTYSGVWNTNQTGFTALAGGCRIFNGKWAKPGMGVEGFWWTSSVRYADGQMWYRYMDYKNANIFRYVAPFTYGCSIRCVKDPQ